MKVIGLCGQAGSGKDTIAKIMKEEGLIDHQFALATGVKQIAKTLFGADPKRRTPWTRKIWQQVGSKMREIQLDVWIKYIHHYWQWIPDIENKTITITDIRFKNEINWLLDRGWHVIYIDGTEYSRRMRLDRRDNSIMSDDNWDRMNSHSSETESFEFAIQMRDDALLTSRFHVFDNITHRTYEELKKDFVKWFNERGDLSGK